MSGPLSRIRKVAEHLTPDFSSFPSQSKQGVNFHTLSPTTFLLRAVEIEPNAEAIHHVSRSGEIVRRTYQELANRARGLAYFLKKHELRRVGILCPNTPAFLESIYGIGAAGGVNVAINYRLKADDITYIFTHAEVQAVIVDAELTPLLTQFFSAHPDVRLLVDQDDGRANGHFDQAIVEGLDHEKEINTSGWAGLKSQADDENDLIALAYTSGTTARPKGVEYTHRGAYLAALANVVESGLNKENGRARYLWTLPMFHAMGWTYPWAVTAARGTHYCLRKIDYTEIWRLLKHEQITHYNAAPTVNTLLCNAKEAAKLPHTVRVTVAASPPSAHLFKQMTDLNLIPVHMYGLTETYGPITKAYQLPSWDTLPEPERYARMARQGHGFITSLAVRVIKNYEAEGTIEDVAKDGKEIGEIVFIGNICARGYYKNTEATRKLFAGGVLHSGDLAVWHTDGSIQILDRAKDIIISGGENISSVAVESMLVTHPQLLEAAVVAIPDSKWGEQPKAFVTVKSGSNLSVPELARWAKTESGISNFMVPKEFEIIAELPKTSTGKVKKAVLREWARGGDRTQS